MEDFSAVIGQIAGVGIFLAVLAVAGWLAKQHFIDGGIQFLQPRSRRRLGLVEYTAVGSRRALMLVRRDNVEHLILTGGPVDVVIETGIVPAVRNGALMNEGTFYPDAGPGRESPSPLPVFESNHERSRLSTPISATRFDRTPERDDALIELGDEAQAEKLQ